MKTPHQRKPAKPRPRPAEAADEAPPQPGRIVEVQFRSAPPPVDEAIGTEKAWSSPSVDLVLKLHGVQGSSRSVSPRHLHLDPPGADELPVEDWIVDHDKKHGARPRLGNFVRYQFDTPEEAAAAAAALRELGGEVVSARTVPPAAPANDLPKDPLISTPARGRGVVPNEFHQGQWYLHRTGALEAWRLGARGYGVVVADVDF